MADNWDDSASDTPAAAPARPAAPVVRPKSSKWADEDEDDKPASDWDASSDDEPAKPAGTTTAAPPKKKKGTFKSKIAEKEAAAANARRGAAGELDPSEWATTGEGAGLSVAEQRARELESDLKNTTDLLGAAALGGEYAPSELAELATFNPRNKEDFQKLSNMIMEHVIQRHQSKPLYAAFVDLHVRALAESLRDVDIRKAASTLSTLANEKQKEQRDKASGKKKPKTALKPVLGAAKVNNKVDTSAYDEPLDDFGNDDFM